jgi:hypothetical protein
MITNRPHVHVIGDGEVIVNLAGADGMPELRQAFGATKAGIRQSLRIVESEQPNLLRKWQEIQGGTD